MICPNCKKEVPDGTKFCTYCGAALNSAKKDPTMAQAAAPQAAQPSGQPAAQPVQPAPQKSNKKMNTILIICLVVLLIIVAIVVTVLVMSHNNNKQEETTTVSQTVTAQVQEAVPSGGNSPAIVTPSNWLSNPYTAIAMYNARGTERNSRSYVTLRSAPSRDSAEVTKIPNGSQITVRSADGYDSVHNIHYRYVDYGSYSGWVRTDFIE